MFANALRSIIALAFIVFLASCAGGRDFDRPAPGSLVVGETTKSEVLARYGQPWKTRSNKVNEHSIENLVYAYSDGGDPLVTGVKPTRALDVFFQKGTLVGYAFMSSYKSDHTDFDETQVKRLKEGDGCDKVAEIFGPAPTTFIYPMTNEQGTKVQSYGYPEVRTGMLSADLYVKSLSVVCDDSGTITAVNFAETGKR